VRLRRKNQIGFGDYGNPELRIAVRAHAHFAASWGNVHRLPQPLAVDRYVINLRARHVRVGRGASEIKNT